MGFQDLRTFFDPTLPLPIGGKVYRIPAADAAFGLWCQQLLEIGALVQAGKSAEEIGDLPPFPLEDGTLIEVTDRGKVGDETLLYQRLLGPVWDALHADSVSWPEISMVAQTALFWIGSGIAAAEAYWNSGGNPEAPAPNRQARRSPSTGGANTTRKRASTSTTKSPRTGTGR